MENPRSSLRRTSKAPLIVVLLVLLGAAGFWASRRLGGDRAQRPEPQAPPAPAAPAGAPAPEAPAAAPVEARDLGADVSQEEVRALADAASPSELYRRVIAQGDLARRAAVLIDNLGEGVSPRRQLEALRPERPFAAVRRGDETVIAPASYARYDDFAEAIASVDARAAARAYRSLHTVLELAYRALGYPDASLDEATARALGRLEAAPVVEEDLVVVQKDGLFLFQDEKLEASSQVDKHLLRMGPRNTRLVQAKAKELREALGLPSSAARR